MFKKCPDVLKYFILFLPQGDIFSLSLVNKYNYFTLKQSKLYEQLIKYKKSKSKNILFWASGNGHLETVKYLVSLGADIKAEDNYIVRLASGSGHLETIKYLVSLGADIKAQNNYAVQLASEYGHLETVKYLVSLGADVKAEK